MVNPSPCRYKKVSKRNSCVVQFGDGEIGEIQFFITKPCIVLYEIFLMEMCSFKMPTRLQSILFQVKRSGTLGAQMIEHITRKCILIELDADVSYVSTIPNIYETD